MGKPLGPRTAWLASRMFGDELEISRRDFRRSWRRHRPRLPPSRERDRAILLGVPSRGDGEFLGSQRLSPGRRRENVEEPGEFRHHPRGAERLAGRSPAFQHAKDALPAAYRLDARRPAREPARTRSLVSARKAIRRFLLDAGPGILRRTRRRSQPAGGDHWIAEALSRSFRRCRLCGRKARVLRAPRRTLRKRLG